MHRRRVLVAILLSGSLLFTLILWPWLYENVIDMQATIIYSSDQLAGTWKITNDDYPLPDDVAKLVDVITIIPCSAADGMPGNGEAGRSKSDPVTGGVLVAGDMSWSFIVDHGHIVFPDDPIGGPFGEIVPDGFFVMGVFHPRWKSFDRLSVDLSLASGMPLQTGSPRIRYSRVPPE